MIISHAGLGPSRRNGKRDDSPRFGSNYRKRRSIHNLAVIWNCFPASCGDLPLRRRALIYSQASHVTNSRPHGLIGALATEPGT